MSRCSRPFPRILSTVDTEMSAVVKRSFKNRGVDVQESARLTGIEGARELTISWDAGAGEQSKTFDQVVVSIGRAPVSSGIGLEATGIGVNDRGFVVVNGNCRTSVDGVYAAGDVIDTPQLAHVGFAEITIVKTILGEAPTPIDYDKVPWVIYCRPEVASCGLTERSAHRRGHDVVVAKHRFGGDGRAMIIGETEGLVKLVTDADGLLLGVHIAGPWATELLGEGYLSVNWEANAADIAALVHPHPTLERGVRRGPRCCTHGPPVALNDRGQTEGRRSGGVGGCPGRRSRSRPDGRHAVVALDGTRRGSGDSVHAMRSPGAATPSRALASLVALAWSSA